MPINWQDNDARLDPTLIKPEERIMQGATIKQEYAMGNVFIRKVDLKAKGTTIEGHTHSFDHISFVGGKTNLNFGLGSFQFSLRRIVGIR